MPAGLAEAAALAQGIPSGQHDFFGVATILRSLILFNLLFAVQTVLDVTYLWGNATLPADISYASYAHRGAHCHGAIGGGFCSRRHEARWTGRAINSDPAAGLFVGSAECPAGDVIDPAP